MGILTAVLMGESEQWSLALIEDLSANHDVAEVILVDYRTGDLSCETASAGKLRQLSLEAFMGAGINRLLDEVKTDYLLIILPGQQVVFGQRALERFLSVARETGAALVYSDFRDSLDGHLTDHPLIDYQPGSIRDSFDFGSVMMLSIWSARQAQRLFGPADERLRWGGLYDLRLKLSEFAKILRIPEPLYTRTPSDRRATGERQFDYVDPRQRDYQVEMEEVATRHLQRIGAYLPPIFQSRPAVEQSFPARASVVIPVRNRERTIKDAALSALSQRAPFDFNVIVVDNHSTDSTTEILRALASEDRRLIHMIPDRNDLGIGGCWNLAVYSSHCGEYAIQLDSDDLYSDTTVLERVVATFEEGRYAMVIGSYKIVSFDLDEIPPGLIDHKEWTRDNGRNNALRINGLGAPRAFYVPVLREWGLPNVSYGEDYSVALRISRYYEIGRIYEPIYYARRWEGNSDAALPISTSNRYDAYKDYLRSVEIAARKRMRYEMGSKVNR
jgi:hypothetical protein